MADSPIPSAEELRNLLDYDPSTGVMTWRARDACIFRPDRLSAATRAKIWNAQFAGQPALNHIDSQGYRVGHLLQRYFKAHRVIWAWMTGDWPGCQIDHINGIRDDNRWCNLRYATASENSRNARMRPQNKSGHNGIGWHKASGRWRARITIDGVQTHLGVFETKEEAVAARLRAQIESGAFSARHGRPIAI